ncbi:MAG: T9SS type A sorting domain-containing protein [Candidatus Bipolaricaulia bacterium]
MRFVAILLTLGLLGGTAHAQDFFVEKSMPVHGATEVPLSDTVAFSFNEEVDVNTNWNTAFVQEPEDQLQFDRVSLCINFRGVCDTGEGTPRHVRFRELEHEPDTDYTWLVYAVRSAGGRSMTEPYVLRYTTASSLGQGRIQGSVVAPKTTGRWTESLRSSLRTIAEGLRHGGRGHLVFDRPKGDASDRTAPAASGARPGARFGTVGNASASAGPYTQILLIDEFSMRESEWTVRAADVLIGSSGSYTLDFVRSGSYVPIAVRYTDGTNSEIDALGFYDPDGDGTPNSIDVQNDQRTGIDLELFDFPLTEARADSNLPVAVDSAAQYASDQELRWIEAGYGIRTTGRAYEWTYRFYSPSKELKTEVTVDPLGADVDTTTISPGGGGFLPNMRPLPDDFLDSGEALGIALDDGGRDFIDQFRSGTVTTVLEGGNLYWTDSPWEGREFWRVRFIAATGRGVESYKRFVDMQTGASIPVELARFTAVVDGREATLRWQTASETQNAGFEVQHTPGDSATAARWRTLGFVEGAGTTQTPQTYQLRTDPLVPGRHRFRLKQIDTDGTAHFSDVVSVTLQMEQPLRLSAPRPHPVRETSTLRFGVQDGRQATLTVYDALGRHIETLFDGTPSPGTMRTVRLDADRLSSGTYFVRLQAGGRSRTRRVTVVR